MGGMGLAELLAENYENLNLAQYVSGMFMDSKCEEHSTNDGTETVIDYGKGTHMHCNDLDGEDCTVTPIAVDPRCPAECP